MDLSAFDAIEAELDKLTTVAAAVPPQQQQRVRGSPASFFVFVSGGSGCRSYFAFLRVLGEKETERDTQRERVCVSD